MLLTFISENFVFTTITCAMLGFGFAYLFSKFLYTQIGRVAVDLAWVISGTGTLGFVVFGMATEHTMPATQTSYQQLFDYIENINHESVYLLNAECGISNNYTPYRTEKCNSLNFINVSSLNIGLQLLSQRNSDPKTPWVGVSSLSLKVASPEIYPKTLEDQKLENELNRFLSHDIPAFNQVMVSLGSKIDTIKIVASINHARLLFLHLSIIAATLRVGRSVHELIQLKKEKSLRLSSNKEKKNADDAALSQQNL